jgi:hypothetical protein
MRKKLERKIEAAGKAHSKVQASEATALVLVEHADRNMEDLEQEQNIAKSADKVEQRLENRNRNKNKRNQKNFNSGTQYRKVQPARKSKSRTKWTSPSAMIAAEQHTP